MKDFITKTMVCSSQGIGTSSQFKIGCIMGESLIRPKASIKEDGFSGTFTQVRVNTVLDKKSYGRMFGFEKPFHKGMNSDKAGIEVDNTGLANSMHIYTFKRKSHYDNYVYFDLGKIKRINLKNAKLKR